MKNYDWYEGLPFSQLTMWGLVQDGTHFVNFYTEPHIQDDLFVKPIVERTSPDQSFSILDAGGGDGVLTELMIRLLLDHGREDFSVTNVDNGAILVDAIRRKANVEESVSSRWDNQFSDLRKLTGQFDFVASRFVMQYAASRYAKEMSTKGQTQQQLLQATYNVLKPGGMAIVAFAGSRSALEQYALQALNSEILAQIQAGMMTGPKAQFKQNFRTRSYTDIEYFVRLAQNAGFIVTIGRELTEYKMGLGEEAYWNRFGKKAGWSFTNLRWAISLAEASWEGLFKDIYGFEPERHPTTGAIVYPTLYFQLIKQAG